MLQRVSNEAFDYDAYFNEMEMEKPKDNMTKSRKLKLSLWEYVKYKFKKKSELNLKSRILLRSVKIMKKNLDISLLINRLFDIEKLKLMFRDEEFDLLNSQKPKIIMDEKTFDKIQFKSVMEKDFQRNFCIRQETQQIRKPQFLRNKQKEIKNFENITKTVSFKQIILDKEDDEKKKVEMSNNKFLIELGRSGWEKKEKEKFQDFEDNIGEENIDKNINSSGKKDLFIGKNFTGEI